MFKITFFGEYMAHVTGQFSIKSIQLLIFLFPCEAIYWQLINKSELFQNAKCQQNLILLLIYLQYYFDFVIPYHMVTFKKTQNLIHDMKTKQNTMISFRFNSNCYLIQPTKIHALYFHFSDKASHQFQILPYLLNYLLRHRLYCYPQVVSQGGPCLTSLTNHLQWLLPFHHRQMNFLALKSSLPAIIFKIMQQTTHLDSTNLEQTSNQVLGTEFDRLLL